MGRSGRVPLAGVPHHSLERHLATLIARGHRIAICEQLSATPVRGETAGRGLIERDVVRVVTPGTILEPGLLHSKANNYLAAFVTNNKRAGIAYADVTTGYFAATEIDEAAAEIELQRIAPLKFCYRTDSNSIKTTSNHCSSQGSTMKPSTPKKRGAGCSIISARAPLLLMD
jgi:DNA mismatch repair protein MutS